MCVRGHKLLTHALTLRGRLATVQPEGGKGYHLRAERRITSSFLAPPTGSSGPERSY